MTAAVVIFPSACSHSLSWARYEQNRMLTALHTACDRLALWAHSAAVSRYRDPQIKLMYSSYSSCLIPMVRVAVRYGFDVASSGRTRFQGQGGE